MRDLADIHYPTADLIRVVMDNLSTHNPGALYETFQASEAHRILQRLEFHYTPKHASWLNMVEIEIGVLRGQCLDRRIGERDVLVSEVDAWQRQRNVSGARIKWKFTTQKARDKLARAYPDTAKVYNHCEPAGTKGGVHGGSGPTNPDRRAVPGERGGPKQPDAMRTSPCWIGRARKVAG